MEKWLQLETGSNTVRIITDPYQYYAHTKFLMDPTKGKHSQRLLCPTLWFEEPITEICPLCIKAPAKPRWFIGVINRADNKPYFLDLDYSMFDQLKNIARSLEWGRPEDNYDIRIQMEWAPFSDLRTSHIFALPPTKLTKQEQELKDSIDKQRLTNMCRANARQLLDQIRDLEK